MFQSSRGASGGRGLHLSLSKSIQMTEEEVVNPLHGAVRLQADWLILPPHPAVW